VRRFPNLAVSLILHTVGITLVMVAIVLLLQSFGVRIPEEAVRALVLLAIGLGILAGMRNR
jgi:hypothetical protein